ncbi:MAG: type II toxin-antitoxin system VapC family toxin [Proteobacteria bacterium]|nr:type II toxin-antitoxin system VapC family toxin [Pseudomonadota bacterium]
MSVVLDASVTLAWIYPDETTPAVRGLFETVGRNGAMVPALWQRDRVHGLTAAVRRGRIDAALADLAQPRGLPLAPLDRALRSAAEQAGVAVAGA